MKQTDESRKRCGFFFLIIAIGPLVAGCSGSNAFRLADADKDSKVSPAEFDRYMLEAIFAEADANSDSKVTFEEWKSANPDADPVKFKVPDTDKDGSVTPAEAKRHFDRVGTMADLFAKIDTGGDGYLTKEEVRAFKQKLESQSGSTPIQKLSNAAQ